MTDLASPLLFVYNGDVKKAFWIFVQVMNLFVSPDANDWLAPLHSDRIKT